MVCLIIDQANLPAFFCGDGGLHCPDGAKRRYSARLVIIRYGSWFFCYQIIDENADICLGAIQDQLFFSFYFHGALIPAIRP